MNVLDYVRRYSNTGFEKKGFTELDNIVFSLLSYVYYDGIVSTNGRNKMTLKQVRDFFFKMHPTSEIKRNLLATRNAIKLLDEVSKTKRYKNILMYNYVSISDKSQQFCAITFEINSKLIYVSFEGTNHLISGWEEDCMMAYMFPVGAQRNAIRYLNRNFSFKNYNIIVGGHSKGGNLALVSSMYCNFFVRSKIIKIYNNDGPGLRQEQIESKNYKNIKDRLVHIVPNYTMVGLLLRHSNNYLVVKSNRLGLFAHDALSWQIDDDMFIPAKLSKFSRVLDEGFLKWLDKYDDKKRKEFVDYVFEIFEKNNISSLIEIVEDNRLILTLLKETKNIHSVVKEMLKDLIVILRQCNKEQLTFKIDKEEKTI